METAIGISRPGGGIGRVGVPEYATIRALQSAFCHSGGGTALVRGYILELVLERRAILDASSTSVVDFNCNPGFAVRPVKSLGFTILGTVTLELEPSGVDDRSHEIEGLRLAVRPRALGMDFEEMKGITRIFPIV